ncbi:MAG TPA: prolyl oligopeptidase family serine peptidase [Kofleriaceae bacterium]|nr:prolyl oligopeptidase family serine peptidase [Kofleriaceae bacterium]
MKVRTLTTVAFAVFGVSHGAYADTPKKPPADPNPFEKPHGVPASMKPTPPPSTYAGLGAESMSPEDVAKFAAPPLDPKVSRMIQSMLDVRGAGGGAITKDGKRQYYTSSITGTPQVWRQDGPMKLPSQMTGGEDRTSVAGLAPDDSFLVVSRDIGGSENPGIYLMKPEGGPLEVIQHTAKVQTALAYIADDSKSLYFTANDIKPDSYAIYRFDMATKKKELVFDTPGLWDLADHKGNQWLLVKNLGSTHQEVYTYDLDKKQLTPLLGQNENEQYDVSLGAKKDQVLVLTNKPSEYFRLYSFEGGKLDPISPEVKYDVESFAIDEARSRIYYTVNEDGYGKLNVLDAKSLKPVALPKLPAADQTAVASLTRNGRYATFVVSGSQMPQTSVVYDWQTKKSTTWRTPDAPEVDVTKFAKHTLEYYPARDGTKIPMFVRRPDKCAADPCPVLITFHGGPEGQARPGFSAGGQLYVDAGFILVEPNVRGSTGYGKAWFHADDGPKRLNVITDIEDAVKFVKSSWAKNGVAPKVGVYGGSYGGYSTLIAMSKFGGAYDAGVALYSISSLDTFLMNTAPYRRILRISEYGDPVKDKEALKQLSPVTYISNVKTPLLLVQGLNDPRTPVGEAKVFYDELVNRKIPTGLIIFPDEGHGAAKRSNIVLQIGHTIAFFQKQLLAK